MHYVLLTSRLDADHGGLTASLLRKARILHQQAKITPVIATFHDAVEFEQVAREIRDRYALDESIRLINLNHHYRALVAKHRTGLPVDEVLAIACTDLPRYETKTAYDAAGAPYACTVSVEGQPVRRFYQCPDGTVYQCRSLIPAGEAPSWRVDGTSYGSGGFSSVGGMTVGALPDSAHQVVLEPGTTQEQRFQTMDGFRRHFINELTRPPVTYLVGEARLLDKALLTLENRFARKILVFHSVHLRPDGSTIRTGNRFALKHLNRLDALVVLTQAQKADIVQRFGAAERIHVIPHAIVPPGPPQFDQRIPGKVVMATRLSPEKNVASAIRAFSSVRRAHPEAHLEVWGNGPKESELKTLINQLGLADAVRLAGYTNQMEPIFRQAECSLLTSRWEGFPLALMETMAAGTPCLAFDIKYGPADMIRPGVDGFLVPPGDEPALARQLIDYLGLSAAAKQELSTSAWERMQCFSEERLAQRWQELFAALIRPVAARPPLLKRLWRRVPVGLRERLGQLFVTA
ncbi:MAG: glycosyltransferase [Bifidobacteriaceae bacterium]|nr:glycosyltransferase [Bifidobacteriaceae bacterium]